MVVNMWTHVHYPCSCNNIRRDNISIVIVDMWINVVKITHGHWVGI